MTVTKEQASEALNWFDPLDAKKGAPDHRHYATLRQFIEQSASQDSGQAPAPTQQPTRWHELKTDPEVFDVVASGAKTHEIRRNDRNFKVGDGLLLRRTRYTGAQMHMRPEACPLEYTGEECRRVVSHVLSGYGLNDGWVILSFAALSGAAPTPQPELTDERIEEVAARIGSTSLHATRMHELGGATRTIFDPQGLIEFVRAIEREIRSMLAASPTQAGEQPVAAGVPASRVGDLLELARQYAHAYFNHHTGSQDGMLDKTQAALRAALSAGVAVAPDNRISVDRGALQMALNVLCRAGKNEVADALAESADAGVPPSDGGQRCE